MRDLFSYLSVQKRPRLLTDAARYLAQHSKGLRANVSRIDALVELEAELDAARRERSEDYSVNQHIAVLARVIGAAHRTRSV